MLQREAVCADESPPFLLLPLQNCRHVAPVVYSGCNSVPILLHNNVLKPFFFAATHEKRATVNDGTHHTDAGVQQGPVGESGEKTFKCPAALFKNCVR